jgi:hypothetical protein
MKLWGREKNIITFTDIDNPEGVLKKPSPALEYIPEWYKNAKAYLHPSGKQKLIEDGSPYASVKKCMPVFDMMTAGYIMETPYDIYITQTPEGPYFRWNEMAAVAFQSMEQIRHDLLLVLVELLPGVFLRFQLGEL